jgi:hypothetical protein
MKKIIICIIILIIIIIIKRILLLYKKCNNDNIKTGDIVLFRSKNKDYLTELIISFTHIGMIIFIDNKPYILETHSKNDPLNIGVSTEGVNIYNFYNRINKFEGHIYLLKLKKPLNNIQENKLITNIDKYKKIKFIKNYKNYYKKYCLINLYKNTNKGMICSEFIYYILNNIGLIQDSFYKCKIPSDFLKLKKLYFFDGYIK